MLRHRGAKSVHISTIGSAMRLVHFTGSGTLKLRTSLQFCKKLYRKGVKENYAPLSKSEKSLYRMGKKRPKKHGFSAKVKFTGFPVQVWRIRAIGLTTLDHFDHDEFP